MRLVVAATALLAAGLINDPAYATAASPGGSNPYLITQPWGITPNGGDSSCQPKEDNQNTTLAPDEVIVSKSTPSQILGSVSSGGALPRELLSSSAFVGSPNPSAQTVISQRRKPPFGAGEGLTEKLTPHSSVATDRLYDTESILTQNKGLNEEKSEEEVPIEKNNGPLKVLFLSSDTGGGHRASAEALANQFQRHFPGTTYDLFDIWTDVDSSWPYYTIKDTYKSFSATPWKWRALYHVSNTPLYAKIADLHSYYMNEEKIREKMRSYDPDVVVSVHPTMNYVPLYSIRKISEQTGKEIPFFTVVTDFGSGHCTWFNKDVDKIYLASDPIKRIAQDRGDVPDEKIVMSGLPIRHDFAKLADAMADRTSPEGKSYQANVKEQLNLDPNKRMVLVMGGGEGVGSLSNIVDELYAKMRTQGVNATICVICGRNEKLKADLETRCWDDVVSASLNSYESLKSRVFSRILHHASRSRRIQIALDRAAAKAVRGKDIAETPGEVDVVPLGFVTNIAEYMVAADILVSKAGPGTIAEAAAVGLPVMVTSHLPGQEAGNVDIVLNGGFGDFCEDPESIALEVACWLQDSQLLDVMSQKAKKVGHPHAAEEIALDIGETTHRCLGNNKLNSKRNQQASQV